MAQALVTLVNGGMLASASGAPPRTQSPAGGSESDGHLRTFQIALRAAFAQVKVRESERISFHIPDPRLGVVKLSGLYRVSEGSDTLVLILHGLASCAESLQCSEAADGADSAGCSSLRLSMRGADLSGEDIYHAGQARNRPRSEAYPRRVAGERSAVWRLRAKSRNRPSPRIAGPCCITRIVNPPVRVSLCCV